MRPISTQEGLNSFFAKAEKGERGGMPGSWSRTYRTTNPSSRAAKARQRRTCPIILTTMRAWGDLCRRLCRTGNIGLKRERQNGGADESAGLGGRKGRLRFTSCTLGAQVLARTAQHLDVRHRSMGLVDIQLHSRRAMGYNPATVVAAIRNYCYFVYSLSATLCGLCCNFTP